MTPDFDKNNDSFDSDKSDDDEDGNGVDYEDGGDSVEDGNGVDNGSVDDRKGGRNSPHKRSLGFPKVNNGLWHHNFYKNNICFRVVGSGMGGIAIATHILYGQSPAF